MTATVSESCSCGATFNTTTVYSSQAECAARLWRESHRHEAMSEPTKSTRQEALAAENKRLRDLLDVIVNTLLKNQEIEFAVKDAARTIKTNAERNQK